MRIFSLLFCILFLGGLSAQTDSTAWQPRLLLGVQYGQSWNEVNFSPRVPQTPLMGQRLGLAIRYQEANNLGIHVELAYDRRGWAERQDELTSIYTRTIDYAELAAFSHIGFTKTAFRPIAVLGSYLSYPIAQAENIPSDWNPDLRDYFGEQVPDRLQYGLSGGIGFEWQLGGLRLQVDGRYRSALGGLYPSNDTRFFFSNNQGFAVQGALLFKLF